MRRVVGYARVSTIEQSINQHALEQQISRLKAVPDIEILFDVDSGANPDRPAFKQLLEKIKTEQVSIIYATRGDRLARDYRTYLNLKDLLKAHNVVVKLLDEGDLVWETAAEEFTADIRALLAEDERRRIQERVSRGFEYRRKRKVACARAPFGYQTVNDEYVLDERPCICLLSRRPDNYLKLSLEPDESPLLINISRADIAREMIQAILQTRRPRTALRQMYDEYGLCRKKGKNTVLSNEFLLWGLGGSMTVWCQNPVLRGHTAYLKTVSQNRSKRKRADSADDWEMHYDTHPDQRLMSEETFDELQAIFQCNRKKLGDFEKGSFYLTGLVYCQSCNDKMILKNSQVYSYYGCRNSGLGCDNRKNIRTETLDEAIIGHLFERACTVKRPQDNGSDAQEENSEISILREQIHDVERSLARNPHNRFLQISMRDMKRELAEQLNPDRTLAFIQATAEHIINHPQAKELAFWYTLSERERTEIYDKLIKSVTVSPAGQVIEVTLKIQ